MRNHSRKLSWFAVCSTLLLMYVVNFGPINDYIKAKKNDAVKVDVRVQTDEELRKQIESWKAEKEVAPIDAQLDRVWKSAVPGYNGRVIDIEASIERMKKSGKKTPDQLIYKQVPPQISLEQLGPNPIYRGNPQKPVISFMINVAWGNEHLESMLDTLDRYGIKTTFFLDGSWVKRNPELAKKIAQRGHEIGNHAYSHPDMNYISDYMKRQEVGKTQAIIQKTIGITPTLFAPPSGAFNRSVVNIVQNEFKMKTIMWTADTVDWKEPPLQTVLSRIKSKMGNGTLVLMHPTNVSKQALPKLIELAKQKGLTPTTVSQVISSERADAP